MTISQDEAAKALREAQASAERSTSAISYRRLSANLILWGGLWVVINLLGFLRAPYGAILWPMTLSLGVVGSFVLGLRATGAGQGRRNFALRAAVVAAALALFFAGVQIVSPITSFIVGETIVTLGIGAAYMLLGIAAGYRLSLIGAALMAATLVGYLYAREQFFLWMAFVGGGGLILGGVWLRKA